MPIAWLTTPYFNPTYRELEQTAPFVLIAIESDTVIKLVKYQWDGLTFKQEELNSRKPHLWLSSSLYDPEKHHIFQTLFDKEKSELNIFKNNLSFHKGLAQPLNSSVYMEKEQNIQTVSITTFIKKESGSKLKYLDLKKENPELSTISF